VNRSSIAAQPPALPLGFKRIYDGYAYSYPHKSAYRPLAPGRRLRSVWAGEQRDRLALYIHVPFCEMRCGFCNLFTTANPQRALTDRYLDALQRQAQTVAEELGDATAVRLAVGGGTPTYLEPAELARLFDLAAGLFRADPRSVAASVETSPRTATRERLAILAERGIERISIGAQSFVDAEVRAMGRPQKCAELETALGNIRDIGFPSLNIDLIYGAAGQTAESWRSSIRHALHFRPEEIYLYPLYVRPLTGLDGRAAAWDAQRLALYRAGRDLLLGEDYVQVSMRMFRRRDSTRGGALDYCCQEDGMVGLGAGARSTTRQLHYSTEYAVRRAGVLAIIDAYCAKDADAFRYAEHGVELDQDDQMRRFVVKSILRVDGLDRARFRNRFGADPLVVFAPLQGLLDSRLLDDADGSLVPTAAGLELSDAIGPWLTSSRIRLRMEAFQCA
jgi:oxygen-independent coproporphyrinogen III oxidase